jgi:hypothetical protein
MQTAPGLVGLVLRATSRALTGQSHGFSAAAVLHRRRVGTDLGLIGLAKLLNGIFVGLSVWPNPAR